MTTTLFISDLHLQPTAPAITAIFYRFLREQASKADALYILGDLFEFWIGDDATDEYAEEICSALKQLSQTTPIYIMHGNRDFLLGKNFIGRCGATLLPDPTVIHLYGTPVVLTHGDLLCTDDKNYQKLRRYLRQSWLQQIFLRLPLKWRQKIAQRLRQQSQRYVSQLAMPTMDATPTAIKMMLDTYQVSHMIHGHTHCPNIHYLHGLQKPAWRYVLSDWHHNGHVLTYSANKPPQQTFIISLLDYNLL